MSSCSYLHSIPLVYSLTRQIQRQAKGQRDTKTNKGTKLDKERIKEKRDRGTDREKVVIVLRSRDTVTTKWKTKTRRD